MKENLKELTGLSYFEAVESLCEQLSNKFGDLRSPDNDTEVLAIARGGLIPATYVVYRLGCPINIMYLRSYPKPNMQKEVEAFDILPFKNKKVPKRIIVVDDIQDTGKTFDFVRKFFKENYGQDSNNVEMIYSSVIWRVRPEVSGPDFYGSKTESMDWVIFPYDHQVD